MGDVAVPGMVEPCTGKMRARELARPVLSWRRGDHDGPPLARNGPQGTDSTPVLPGYFSPGLPEVDVVLFLPVDRGCFVRGSVGVRHNAKYPITPVQIVKAIKKKPFFMKGKVKK